MHSISALLLCYLFQVYNVHYTMSINGKVQDGSMEIDAGNNLETFKTGSGNEEAVEVHDFQIVSTAIGSLTPFSPMPSPHCPSSWLLSPGLWEVSVPSLPTQTSTLSWLALTARPAVSSKMKSTYPLGVVLAKVLSNMD